LEDIVEGTRVLDDETKAALKKAMEAVSGVNRSHYQYPTDEELCEGAIKVLEKLFDTISKRGAILIERNTLAAVAKVNKEWYDSHITPVIDVFADDKGSVCLARGPNQCRIIIVSSWFKAYGENVTNDVRLRSVQGFCGFLNLMHASNPHIKWKDVQLQKRIACTYLMNSVGFLGGYEESTHNGPRRQAFSNTFFSSPKERIMVFSNHMKTSYADVLYLRNALGPKCTRILFHAYGIFWDDNFGLPSNGPCPIDSDFHCQGIPQLGHADGRPCSDVHNRYLLGVVGTKDKEHTFAGLLVCNSCRRHLRRIEKAYLRGKRDSGENFSDAEAKRLEQLEERRRKKKLSENHATKEAHKAVKEGTADAEQRRIVEQNNLVKQNEAFKLDIKAVNEGTANAEQRRRVEQHPGTITKNAFKAVKEGTADAEQRRRVEVDPLKKHRRVERKAFDAVHEGTATVEQCQFVVLNRQARSKAQRIAHARKAAAQEGKCIMGYCKAQAVAGELHGHLRYCQSCWDALHRNKKKTIKNNIMNISNDTQSRSSTDAK